MKPSQTTAPKIRHHIPQPGAIIATCGATTDPRAVTVLPSETDCTACLFVLARRGWSAERPPVRFTSIEPQKESQP